MMDDMWPAIIWRQFEATIEMFSNALEACPEKLWETPMWNDPQMPSGFSEFWYVAYHTLFWLDLYLSGSTEGFIPPPPYTLDELDPQGILPERTYRRSELLAYLEHCRHKCQVTIEQLTDVRARLVCTFSWAKDGICFGELLLDNMRHVQEHAAQLNMFIGQQAGLTSRWIGQVKDS